MKLFVLISALLVGLPTLDRAWADERTAPAAQLLAEGYQPQITRSLITNLQRDRNILRSIRAHEFAWPVAFASASETLGNVMAQFQPFDNPAYWHGGIDIRTQTAFELRTPVGGRIEAGHYSYSTNADGSMTKFFKPWPASGLATYFEVAVIRDDGLRFEYHHVDRARLPQAIISMLNRGGARVDAGTELGFAVPFSASYTHIHYNVILPSGVRVNPEYLSTLIPDHFAPQIIAAAAVMRSGRTEPLTAPLTETPAEFIIATIDKLDLGPYEHPPAAARVIFENGVETLWDFRQSLTDSDGTFPVLSEYFLDKITLAGRTFRTTGGYGTGLSLVRLKTPVGAAGKFSIALVDQSGNASQVLGSLQRRQ